MFLSCFKFLVSMVTHFWPKCFKTRSKLHIFANIRARVTLFSKMKQFIKLKEIPRDGANRCITIAPSDLLIFNVNLNNVKNVSATCRNTKY